MILDDISRKQLTWYGHVERMDPTRLPKIMIHWKPEGRKKKRPSPENLERWNIYSHEWKRSKNGRMEQSKAMEYESRKASPDVLKQRNLYNRINLTLRENGEFSHGSRQNFCETWSWWRTIRIRTVWSDNPVWSKHREMFVRYCW